MANDAFTHNLLRMLAAETHFGNCVLSGREMFGKSYFSLSLIEKAAVDQAVLSSVGANYAAITPEYLAAQQSTGPIGFQPPPPQKQGS
jgi:hypothetical protein